MDFNFRADACNGIIHGTSREKYITLCQYGFFQAFQLRDIFVFLSPSLSLLRLSFSSKQIISKLKPGKTNQVGRRKYLDIRAREQRDYDYIVDDGARFRLKFREQSISASYIRVPPEDDDKRSERESVWKNRRRRHDKHHLSRARRCEIV